MLTCLQRITVNITKNPDFIQVCAIVDSNTTNGVDEVISKS